MPINFHFEFIPYTERPRIRYAYYPLHFSFISYIERPRIRYAYQSVHFSAIPASSRFRPIRIDWHFQDKVFTESKRLKRVDKRFKEEIFKEEKRLRRIDKRFKEEILKEERFKEEYYPIYWGEIEILDIRTKGIKEERFKVGIEVGRIIGRIKWKKRIRLEILKMKGGLNMLIGRIICKDDCIMDDNKVEEKGYSETIKILEEKTLEPKKVFDKIALAFLELEDTTIKGLTLSGYRIIKIKDGWKWIRTINNL